MKRYLYLAVILNLFIFSQVFAQSGGGLRSTIEQIATSKKVTVGVSIVGGDGRDRMTYNGGRHFPLQSVFKLHIGLAMLAEIDRGRFKLDQSVEITKKDLSSDLYSPIRDKYPDGTTLTIREIIEFTVSQSDNVGCEILLKLLGGPQTVERYFVKTNKFEDISIKINEEVQQANWDLQFQNWTTPAAATRVLEAFYTNKRGLLSRTSHEFIWKVMSETSTGIDRLRGNLPPGTPVSHKTGSSGVNKKTGITAAVNDIGVVFLPNGKYFYIAVFVTDSTEDAAANEKLIADIARAAWDHFSAKVK